MSEEKNAPAVNERLNRSTHKKSQKHRARQQERQLKKMKKESKKSGNHGKKKSLPRRIVKGIFVTGLTLTTVGLVGGGIGGVYAWDKYGDMIQTSVTKGYEISKTVKTTDFVTKAPTKLVDKDGKVLKEFKEFQYATPEYKAINPEFISALVSAEDERFYEHHGVDLYGTLRGIASTLQGNGVQGGSTITQQLVRNVILETSEVTVERKLIEQVVSQEVEKTMTKDEIVRHYLNNVYFGNGNYGIAPASKFYFSKDQKDIKLHEAATIIGITNNPSVFDPINNPENSLKKRNRVLGKMLETEAITQAQHDEAVKQPLGIKVTKHGIDNSVTEPAIAYAIQKSTEHLMEKEGFVFQYTFADDASRKAYKERYHEEFMKVRQSILNGGYYISTSIDQHKQAELELVVEKVMSPLQAKDPKTGFYLTQTAITTVDNVTGEVVAIIGGRNEDGNIFNRGFQGARQPGSTIKPVVVYTPAYEMGYTPESQLNDSPVKNGPRNFYDGYQGAMTARYAVEQSVNTVAYKLGNQIGGDSMVGKLAKMKFGSLAPADENPIISLGGFTYGTTSVEMASAYATIANQGVYKEPSNVRLIKDIVTDEVLYKRANTERKVYDSGASYLMVDTLKGVMTKGTGVAAMPNNFSNIIGKSGTTNSNKDLWFVGGSPYYTTAVWTGRDTPSSLPLYERNFARYLFKEWNEELHEGKKAKDFERPDTVWKQNGRWMTSVKQGEQERENRRYADNLRREAEHASQIERLALEDYRILYGLTLEEETAREKIVTDAFEEFYKSPFDKLEQFEEQLEMLEAIKPLIDDVKHQRAVDKFLLDWDASYDRINAKRDAFIAEIERKRLEEERLKWEAEEAIRLEEERKLQEEIDRRVAEELEAQLAKEAEENALLEEELARELAEQEPVEPVEPVEPMPEEPEPTEIPLDEVPIEDEASGDIETEMPIDSETAEQ